MTPEMALLKLRELVRLRLDLERFNALAQRLALCPEVQSTAGTQASRRSFAAHTAANELETELVRALAGAAPPGSWSMDQSADEHTGVPTVPRIPPA